jgi:subtilisin family serine protease
MVKGHGSRSMDASAPRAALAAALLAVLVLPGCLSNVLGGQERTEWAFEITQIEEARQAGYDGRGVVIAILDTGVDTRHPSLDHLVDGDQANGELVAFRDFLGGATGVEAAIDPDGHGSHVTGILAARGSSASDKLKYGGIDLLGAAPAARFVVARVCAAESCDPNAIPPAIRWARDQGADVLSLSLGGEPGLPPILGISGSQVELAVNEAIDAGVVVVASAGNNGSQAGDIESPGSIPGVIAVGAIGKDGKVAEFSSRGDDDGNPCSGLPPPFSVGRCDPDKKPELVAPGVEIISAWTGTEYTIASGTSQATPFVTAVVAMLLQGEPDLRGRDEVAAIKAILTQTARPVEGQEEPHDEAAGYGIVQAMDALRAKG